MHINSVVASLSACTPNMSKGLQAEPSKLTKINWFSSVKLTALVYTHKLPENAKEVSAPCCLSNDG